MGWPNTLTHVVSAWADTKRAKCSLGSHTASLLPLKSLLRLKGRQPRFLFLVEIESVRLRRMYRMMFWPSLENMTNHNLPFGCNAFLLLADYIPSLNTPALDPL